MYVALPRLAMRGTYPDRPPAVESVCSFAFRLPETTKIESIPHGDIAAV